MAAKNPYSRLQIVGTYGFAVAIVGVATCIPPNSNFMVHWHTPNTQGLIQAPC